MNQDYAYLLIHTFKISRQETGNVIKALTCDEKASAYATRSIKPDI